MPKEGGWLNGVMTDFIVSSATGWRIWPFCTTWPYAQKGDQKGTDTRLKKLIKEMDRHSMWIHLFGYKLLFCVCVREVLVAIWVCVQRIQARF